MNRISDLAEEYELTCDYVIEEFLVDEDIEIPTLYVSMKDDIIIFYDAVGENDEVYST